MNSRNCGCYRRAQKGDRTGLREATDYKSVSADAFVHYSSLVARALLNGNSPGKRGRMRWRTKRTRTMMMATRTFATQNENPR